MELRQIIPRLCNMQATQYDYIDALEAMHRFGLVAAVDHNVDLTTKQVAQLLYLTVATNETTRAAAAYNMSEGDHVAWSDSAHQDIVKYLTFLLQDTYRAFGMVDHITFYRNSGAAIVVNETDRAVMHRFDSLLPINATGKDDSTLTGLDIMVVAAYCTGDLVRIESNSPLTTIDNAQNN